MLHVLPCLAVVLQSVLLTTVPVREVTLDGLVESMVLLPHLLLTRLLPLTLVLKASLAGLLMSAAVVLLSVSQRGKLLLLTALLPLKSPALPGTQCASSTFEELGLPQPTALGTGTWYW